MPSVVEIVSWPLWVCAADAGGHWPWAPAWMCMACGAPLSRLLVLIVTWALSPSRRMSARPVAETRLVGMGFSPPGKLSVDAVVLVVFGVLAPLDELSSELPPLSAMPAAKAPDTRMTPSATIQPWRATHERSPGGGRPGGSAAAAAAMGTGGSAGGGVIGSVGAETWVGVPMPVARPAPAPSAVVHASMKSRQPPKRSAGSLAIARPMGA